mmetsp:Transcript_13875/g.20313  ORF Transcript_13875/g.20313 Transcript_13875/m.20313 type:complete len:85 (-) Transcript_13875:281-535(-)
MRLTSWVLVVGSTDSGLEFAIVPFSTDCGFLRVGLGFDYHYHLRVGDGWMSGWMSEWISNSINHGVDEGRRKFSHRPPCSPINR